MTERQLLRLVQIIILAKKRAKKTGCRRLIKALDDASYYAGVALGERLAREGNETWLRATKSAWIYDSKE